MDYNWVNGNIKDQRLENWEQHSIEQRMNYYSDFLRDGDFETYQPYVYKHTLLQKMEAYRNLVRAIWTARRFETINSIRESRLGSYECEMYDRMINLP